MIHGPRARARCAVFDDHEMRHRAEIVRDRAVSSVADIRHDVEARRRAFLPRPVHIGCGIGVELGKGADRVAVAVESREAGGLCRLSGGRVALKLLLDAAHRIVDAVIRSRAAALDPHQIWLEPERGHRSRRTRTRAEGRVHVERTLLDGGRREVGGVQRLEAGGRRVGEGALTAI